MRLAWDDASRRQKAFSAILVFVNTMIIAQDGWSIKRTNQFNEQDVEHPLAWWFRRAETTRPVWDLRWAANRSCQATTVSSLAPHRLKSKFVRSSTGRCRSRLHISPPTPCDGFRAIIKINLHNWKSHKRISFTTFSNAHKSINRRCFWLCCFWRLSDFFTSFQIRLMKTFN